MNRRTRQNMGKRPPAPGTITALRFQKRDPERVNVYIDEAFALGLPALEAVKLHVGQALTASDIERLMQLDAQDRAYDRALSFLSYRPRSTNEVQRYLAEKGLDPAPAEAIIEKLSRLGYLDDRAFAAWWIENRSQFSPRGSYALRQELRLKGVADDIIAEVLETVGAGDEALDRVARSRLSRLSGEDGPAFRRKLSAFLVRRGFSYDEVSRIVEHLWREIEATSENSRDTDEL